MPSSRPDKERYQPKTDDDDTERFHRLAHEYKIRAQGLEEEAGLFVTTSRDGV